MKVHGGEALRDAVAGAFEEAARLLGQLSDRHLFGVPPTEGASPIAVHHRHQLEHGRQLLEGMASGLVDYDARPHDASLSSDRRRLLAANAELVRDLRALRRADLDKPVEVLQIFDVGAPTARAKSTVARELMFLFEHTVHHNALIALLLRLQSLDVPEPFGVMPSTLAARLRAAG
ncbi:DinB family protein [Polyangium aurulentum]|uniref:DinB family protein n=1 Tax=Polyangium aurulentum TaxID=2567896 RepID=UPI0010AE4954|nr:DinB family protein [Polyangium aurulentum]UQA55390.1 DinB family protein [Polyangium aurulentum]